jgi:hypothetical protein
MMPILILVSIFCTGFAIGYAVRARRSHKRQERRRLYTPYGPSDARVETPLGRPRRAF